jgi:hypothetical protein
VILGVAKRASIARSAAPVGFEDMRGSYQVVVPLKGSLASLHRGQQLTSTPGLGSIYGPDAQTATWWPGGSRHLAVKIDQFAVDKALESLIDEPVDTPIAFNASLPIETGAATSGGFRIRYYTGSNWGRPHHCAAVRGIGASG